jgi:hypothetical protein
MVLPRAADFVRTDKVAKAEDTQGRLLNHAPRIERERVEPVIRF